MSEIDNAIKEQIAIENKNTVEKFMGKNTKSLNSLNVWKNVRKIQPKKAPQLPCSIKNVKGHLISNPEEQQKNIMY